MKKISGVLITHNEEDKVGTALASLVGVCDEFVVVDSFSDDATPEICRKFSAKIVQREWTGYADQKQFAAELAENDWILSLDADEYLSDTLRHELLEVKQRQDEVIGFYIPRLTYFMGRWIRHTTWYPDWKLRLYLRTRGRWTQSRVHERVAVEGETGRLKGHIYHNTYSSFSEYLQQLERFSSLAAADSWDRGKRAKVLHLSVYPPIVFLKNYLVHFGFLDGLPGLAVSVMAAVSTFFKYAKLWEMEKYPEKRNDGPSSE